MTKKLKELIRARYGAVARAVAKSGGSCCCTSGCGTSSLEPTTSQLYSAEELQGIPLTAVQASLGCGNPTALADLIPGEVVLDLGSGGGIDVLLSARRVGPTGKAYGLDMTDEMLALARENQRKAGMTNVEFLKGDIEAIPLPDNHVDVIISNCVINLAADKDKVFREAFRTLKPGGRLAVSDIVFRGDVSRIPQGLRNLAEAWAGCVAGALEEQDYIARLKAAGFVDVSITVTRTYASTDGLGCCGLGLPEGIQLVSGFVRARKPGTGPFRIRPAAHGDLPAVRRLLKEVSLPLDGLEDQFSKAYAVAEVSGRVVAVAGLEVHGEESSRHGLLRSVAVDPAWRGQGIGEALVQDRLAWARNQGLISVWLLTTTAAAYFSRFGFAPEAREAAPTALQATVEFKAACPATAVAMRLTHKGCP